MTTALEEARIEDARLGDARLGDEEAFAALYRAHLPYVRSTVRRLLRASEVEDVCQDTFLLAFSRLGGFAGTCTFRSWITRIALNECYMRLRRKSLPLGDAPGVDGEGDDLDRRVFRCEDVQLRSVGARLDVERLFAELRPADRRVLTMAYLDELSLTEVAAALGVSRNVARNRLQKARERARGVVGGE